MVFQRTGRAGVIAVAIVIGVIIGATAAGAAAEDGILTASDLRGDWEETPADGVADFAATVEHTIPICSSVEDLTAEVTATPVDGPTLTQDGQKVSSFVLELDATLAKKVIKTFKGCGSKPAKGVGKDSATWGSPVFEETEDGELKVTEDAYLVLARAGSMLGVYDATGDGTEVDKKAINKGIKAALKRLKKAA